MLSQANDRVDHQQAHRCEVEADIRLVPVLVLLCIQELLKVSGGQLSLHGDAFSENDEQIDQREGR